MGLLMDEARRRQMDEDGFVILPGLFTAAEMDDLAVVLETYEARRQAQSGKDSMSKEVLFSQKVAERDEQVRAFATRPEFVELSTACVGPDTDLYFNQMVFKNPEGASTFSWHQDDAYGPVEPSPYLTVWIAITDATEENGCISVLPGSHRHGLVEHWQSSFGLACHSLDDQDQGILVPLPKGSVVCFWSTLMHKSGPNRSKDVRKAMVLQFSPLGLRHKASGMAIKSRIPVARGGLASRD